MCSAAFHSHTSVHATPYLTETLDQAPASQDMSAGHLFSISHELRTPMNAIMGFSQLLRMEPLSPLQADSVDEIEKASQRMLTLINDLLDLNKINAGRMSLDIEPLALEASARNCIQQLAPLAQAKGIRWHVQIPAIGVLADEQRLHQVVLNLLSNAIKYNRDHGHVQITASVQPDSRVRLSVQDTGYGIPAHQHHTVFAPFERGAAEHSGIEGTGIGLTIAQRIVRQMQGEMGFNSSEGVGTEFWVILPGAAIPYAKDDCTNTPSGAEAPATPHQLIGLTYVSTAARPMSGTDLNSIAQDSKTFNATVDVTGVLLYHGGNFFQYLEGPRQGLEQVMERVCKSRRHHTLYVHFKGEIAQRHFGDWSMDVADLSQPRMRQHTTSLRELEQTWNSDPSTCVGVRHLLNFAEHMTGRAYWATPKTLHPPSA